MTNLKFKYPVQHRTVKNAVYRNHIQEPKQFVRCQCTPIQIKPLRAEEAKLVPYVLILRYVLQRKLLLDPRWRRCPSQWRWKKPEAKESRSTKYTRQKLGYNRKV